MQLATLLAPTVVPKVPAGQAEQLSLEVATITRSKYVPAGHAEQCNLE